VSPADEARRWLQFARVDLRVAEREAATGEFAPHVGCFHAQQSAEKAIKAILVYLSIPFPFRHDLDGLRNLVPAGWHVVTAFPMLGSLTQWAMTGRYPGNWPEATDRDAQDAAALARDVWETVLNDLDQHGLDVSAFR
jgi:HEPN domain-containing protein